MAVLVDRTPAGGRMFDPHTGRNVSGQPEIYFEHMDREPL